MARTTRLVATGFMATNSRLLANMQQKYCDHGRSTNGGVDEHVTDMPSAQILGFGGEGQERINLALFEQLLRLDLRVRDPLNVLCEIEPDLSHDQGHELAVERPRRAHADALSLQFREAIDALPREQLEAAYHHAGQQHQRFTSINRPDALQGIGRGKIDLTADRPHSTELRSLEIADIGEALG